ncbi:uncharacterized protein LOC135146267 isoform X2 [Zophobas morio]|uniref:uncharacterized protein LOC135146267 isoform X2 n=1 Tax=Zophobas morio TaxID=2755281 RepID=UPI003083E06D
MRSKANKEQEKIRETREQPSVKTPPLREKPEVSTYVYTQNEVGKLGEGPLSTAQNCINSEPNESEYRSIYTYHNNYPVTHSRSLSKDFMEHRYSPFYPKYSGVSATPVNETLANLLALEEGRRREISSYYATPRGPTPSIYKNFLSQPQSSHFAQHRHLAIPRLPGVNIQPNTYSLPYTFSPHHFPSFEGGSLIAALDLVSDTKVPEKKLISSSCFPYELYPSSIDSNGFAGVLINRRRPSLNMHPSNQVPVVGNKVEPNPGYSFRNTGVISDSIFDIYLKDRVFLKSDDDSTFSNRIVNDVNIKSDGGNVNICKDYHNTINAGFNTVKNETSGNIISNCKKVNYNKGVNNDLNCSPHLSRNIDLNCEISDKDGQLTVKAAPLVTADVVSSAVPSFQKDLYEMLPSNLPVLGLHQDSVTIGDSEGSEGLAKASEKEAGKEKNEICDYLTDEFLDKLIGDLSNDLLQVDLEGNTCQEQSTIKRHTTDRSDDFLASGFSEPKSLLSSGSLEGIVKSFF